MTKQEAYISQLEQDCRDLEERVRQLQDGTRNLIELIHRYSEEIAFLARAARTRRRAQIKVAGEKIVRGCDRCGYSACARALHYHHRDPSSKEFNVAGAQKRVGRKKVLAEIAKCDLLCANCHFEQQEDANSKIPLYGDPPLIRVGDTTAERGSGNPRQGGKG